jgi:hypothetical protein
MRLAGHDSNRFTEGRMLRQFLSRSTRGKHPGVYETLRWGYRRWVKAFLTARAVTARGRMLPDFLIIGAQKAGTTSLFNYLAAQPGIVAPFRKEIHYFSYEHVRGERWYRAFFPLRGSVPPGALTGEASTYYAFCRRAPARAARLVPGARLVLIARDPVERAFSQYNHSVRKGFETRSFEEAIDREFAELPGEVARLDAEPSYESYFHQHNAYVARGCYMDQLEHWLRWYPRERLLVVRAEDLFSDPEKAYREVLEFLGVEWVNPVEFEPHNQHASSSRLNPATRERLRRFYAPHNARLEAWLGRGMGWS